MINVRVCRGSSFPSECRLDDPNLNWGDDISDALLATVDDSTEPALERGRVEIDTNSTNRRNQSLTIHSPIFMQPGSIIRTVEGIDESNGLLKSINISYSRNGNSVSVGSTVGVEHNVIPIEYAPT